MEVFARELAPCAVVPVAIHFEPLTAPSPSAFIGIGSARQVTYGGEPPDAGCLQRAVEGLLDDLAEVLEAHGEEAGSAWTSTQSYART